MTPSNGWSKLCLTDIDGNSYKVRFSYLSKNVHKEMLMKMTDSIKLGISFSCEFDAEGWEYSLLCTSFGTFIITNGPAKSDASTEDYISNSDDSIKIIMIKEDMRCIAKSLCRDIAKDINKWTEWEMDIDYSDIQTTEAGRYNLLFTIKKKFIADEILNLAEALDMTSEIEDIFMTSKEDK